MKTSAVPILLFFHYVRGNADLFSGITGPAKGIVIGLVDDELRFSALPSCFQDIIFLPRRASLDRISGVLFIAWFTTQLPGYTSNKKTCFDCQHKGLSRQQIRILVNFYRGLSVVQTAQALEMSEKRSLPINI